MQIFMTIPLMYLKLISEYWYHWTLEIILESSDFTKVCFEEIISVKIIENKVFHNLELPMVVGQVSWQYYNWCGIHIVGNSFVLVVLTFVGFEYKSKQEVLKRSVEF